MNHKEMYDRKRKPNHLEDTEIIEFAEMKSL